MDGLKRMLANLLPSDSFDFGNLDDGYLGVYWRRIVIALAFIEDTLRERLEHLGLSHAVQTVVLVAACLALALSVFRMFPGKLRIVFIMVFLGLALHILIPALDS